MIFRLELWKVDILWMPIILHTVCAFVSGVTHLPAYKRDKKREKKEREKKWKSRKSSSVSLIEDKSMAQSVTLKLLFNAVDQLMLSFLNMISIVMQPQSLAHFK